MIRDADLKVVNVSGQTYEDSQQERDCSIKHNVGNIE